MSPARLTSCDVPYSADLNRLSICSPSVDQAMTVDALITSKGAPA